MSKSAFTCIKCGEPIEAKNDLAHRLLESGSTMLCDSCRRGGFVRHWSKDSYQDYLQSDYWKTRRRRALQLAGHRCQICNRNGRLEVHHNTRERLGRELDRDLLVVCKEHHEMIHGIKRE